ncbi:MAG: methylmalonyl-CoA mutase family protein [Halobacteria archaeon]
MASSRPSPKSGPVAAPAAPEPTTLGGIPLKPVYGPGDSGRSPEDRLGLPGEFPFTRGAYATMYRGRLWTMRLFSGYGTPEDANRRLRYLLEHGESGLSIAFHMPTLMGVDSDHPRARGEVGRGGVAIDSLEDMELLFRGIDLGAVTTSMTINSTAIMALAMYAATGEKRSIPAERLGGTLQNDILKEYIAQKEFLFPPAQSLRLVTDVVEHCAKRIPRWHPISVSGYHIREAGSTAVQELAFTLADGFAYVEAAVERGLPVDSFAPRLSFFFNAHMDFFEEIAKFRAARRIWATVMKERFGADDPRSCSLRFHTQTAGCSLTAQQPENNLIRTALEALSAVLGGTQSLHTNSMDEALALPTEKAARLALRTQQIIAHESGVVNTADPLGGSYFVEALTDEVEARAMDLIHRIESMGRGSILRGVVHGIETGWFQREIAEASYRYQREVESGRRIVVGVNAFQERQAAPLEILRIPDEAEERQVKRLKALRKRRDAVRVDRGLERLTRAAETEGVNLVEPVMECVRAYATVGEMTGVLLKVFGPYREPAEP